LKEEALDCTMWRARFGRGFGPVVRQTTKWMNSTVLLCYVIQPDSGKVKADGRIARFKKQKFPFAIIALNFKSRNLLVTCLHNTSRWKELIFEFLSRPASYTIAFMATNPILSMHFDGRVKYL
jgi:hypothetical protein